MFLIPLLTQANETNVISTLYNVPLCVCMDTTGTLCTGYRGVHVSWGAPMIREGTMYWMSTLKISNNYVHVHQVWKTFKITKSL